MKRILLVMLLCVPFFGCAAALKEAPPAPVETIMVRVGNVDLRAPSPPGFFEVTRKYPQMERLVETGTAEFNRSLAAYIEDEYFEALNSSGVVQYNRIMIMQVDREYENADISESAFASYRESLKMAILHDNGNNYDELAQTSKESAQKISKELDVPISLDTNIPKTPEIIFNFSSAIGHLMFMQGKGTINGETIDELVAVGTTLVHVNSKIIILYVVSPCESQKDVNWVKEKSKEWADLILKANGEKGLES